MASSVTTPSVELMAKVAREEQGDEGDVDGQRRHLAGEKVAQTSSWRSRSAMMPDGVRSKWR